jgi:acylphosphatase
VRTGARFVVAGRVQGVGFRAATARRAIALSLDGHALNRSDGSVEVLAAGAPAALDQLHDWLAGGPPLARVEHVRREAIDPAGIGPGFTTG